MEKIWNYGGLAYAFDITDADCISRMTGALAELKKNTELWQERWRNAEECAEGVMIEEHCTHVRRFFDALFGAGEGENVTGGSRSAQTCGEAYFHFLCFVREQIGAFSRVREEVEKQYRERLERIAASRKREGSDGDSQ